MSSWYNDLMNKNEKILLWSSNIWMLGEGMFGPLFAVFTDSIGGNIFDISWIYAVYMVVTGVVMIVVGWLADHRFDRVTLMLIGYFFNFLGTVSYIFVDSLHLLVVAQVSLALGIAFSTPTWAALYDKYSGDGSNDGTAWGLYRGLSYIVSAGAMLVGGAVVSAYSFRVLFVIMSVISFLSFLFALQTLKFRSDVGYNDIA